MSCRRLDAAGSTAAARHFTAWQERVALLCGFLAVAWRYWVCIYPVIAGELRQWRARAGAIPDPSLRALAFEAHGTKRGNLEGAAAFAVFVPRRFRRVVASALVAFQGAYDYVDVLSEQISEDRIASGYRLHLALIAALSPGGGRTDGYAHHPADGDAGYLQAFVDGCRGAVARLPSYRATQKHALEGARRIAVYQGLNNWGKGGGPQEYARWAAEETPAGSDLRWWETGAAAGSSLSVFAAIGAASERQVDVLAAAAIDAAYFPWIGALHTLLDSLVDHPIDVSAGHHSLVGHYGSATEVARHMGEIAKRAVREASALPRSRAHTMLLAAMSCFYLVAPEALLPYAVPACAAIEAAIGDLAGPTMAIMRARQRLHGRGGSTAQISDSQARMSASRGCSSVG